MGEVRAPAPQGASGDRSEGGRWSPTRTRLAVLVESTYLHFWAAFGAEEQSAGWSNQRKLLGAEAFASEGWSSLERTVENVTQWASKGP